MKVKIVFEIIYLKLKYMTDILDKNISRDNLNEFNLT